MSRVETQGQFVWHELLTTDTAAAGAFYPRVAGWKSQPWEKDSSYTLWMNRAGPLGGAIRLPEDTGAAPSHWMPYIGTLDVAATVEAARNLGASVCKELTEIPNGGTYAVLADPQGAIFAVHASSMPSEGGADAASAEGNFSWHELATTDYQAALSFYSELFGWGKGERHDMGELGYYQLFSHGGKNVGGIYRLQPGVTTPHWLSYVRVSDVGKAAKAAKAAGGRVINGPMEVPGGDWIAQIIDPQGAAFAVHQIKQVTPAAVASKPVKTKRKAAKKRVTAKRASARKRASSRRVAKSSRASAAKRSSAAKKTRATRRRTTARKRVIARKGSARRRVRAKKRR